MDSTVFYVMAGTIAVLWLAIAWIAIVVLWQRIADRPATSAIRFGLLIALAAMSVGFLMTEQGHDLTAPTIR